jgi:hypothetical protein
MLIKIVYRVFTRSFSAVKITYNISPLFFRFTSRKLVRKIYLGSLINVLLLISNAVIIFIYSFVKSFFLYVPTFVILAANSSTESFYLLINIGSISACSTLIL